jgi:hypothetical protein
MRRRKCRKSKLAAFRLMTRRTTFPERFEPFGHSLWALNTEKARGSSMLVLRCVARLEQIFVAVKARRQQGEPLARFETAGGCVA